MSGKRVLITGGAGFIGRATAPLLVERGWQVEVIDVLDPQIHGDTVPSLAPGVRLTRGDVRDRGLLRDVLPQVDVVLHLAARTGVGQSMYDIHSYVETNTAGTAVLLEELAQSKPRLRRLVVASSRAVYGEGAYRCPTCGPVFPPVRRRDQLEKAQWEVTCPACRSTVEHAPTVEAKPTAPGSVYAITKRDQEELCLVLGGAYGIETLALRYFNVYGAGQPLSNPYTGVIPAFASRVLGGSATPVYEDGLPLRDFVHVHDIAVANVLAVEADGLTGLALNIGLGEPVSILGAAETVTRVLGGTARPVMTGQYRVGDIRHCYAGISLARRVLGYSPAISFDEGIASMAGWLREQFRGDFTAKAADELAARGLLGKAATT